MKKIFILIICLFISGCSDYTLRNVDVDRNSYSQLFDSVAIGVADNGLYYISDDVLYYFEDNTSVPLGYINYVNGQKSSLIEIETSKNVNIDVFTGTDLICYDDRIFMQYETINYDMSSYYQLASVDLKGEDFKTHIIFDYIPQRIIIDNGNVYVMYMNFDTNTNYIEKYDNNFKLVETREYSQEVNALGFYIENNSVVVPDSMTIYKNDHVAISYRIENLLSDENRKITGTIQVDNQKFSFDNKLVLFVNDDYFYTSSCTYPQVYERYHLDGSLDKHIVINEFIDSNNPYVHFFETDFSYILKLKNEDIVYGHSGQKIFEADFEKGTCLYVN